MNKANITPTQLAVYQPGAILANQWGYEQTNYDFFCIINRTVKPSGDIWLTLVPMTKIVVPGAPLSMETKETPDKIDWTKKGVRRKLHVYHGEETGCQGSADRGGWCRLWNGKAKTATHYA